MWLLRWCGGGSWRSSVATGVSVGRLDLFWSLSEQNKWFEGGKRVREREVWWEGVRELGGWLVVLLWELFPTSLFEVGW